MLYDLAPRDLLITGTAHRARRGPDFQCVERHQLDIMLSSGSGRANGETSWISAGLGWSAVLDRLMRSGCAWECAGGT